MAVSIAKLAILLTTDTSGMQRGFAKARTELTGFQSAVAGISKGLAAIGAAGLALQAGRYFLSVANDSEQARLRIEHLTQSTEEANRILELVKGLGKGVIDDKEIVNATTKLLAFGKTADEIPDILRRLGDLSVATDQSLESLATRFVKSAQSADLLTAAGERAAGALERANNTINGQFQELKENIKDSSLVQFISWLTGTSTRESLRAINNLFLSRGERMDILFPGPAETQHISKIIGEIKGLHDDGRTASKDIIRQIEDMKQRAEGIRQAMRTPQEVFGESMQELDSLFRAGHITLETYTRAAEDAATQFRRAADEGRRAVQALTRTGAVQYGTSAGFSAMHAGQAELTRMAQDAAEQKRHTALLKSIDSRIGTVANF